jgi:hypothetical protein
VTPNSGKYSTYYISRARFPGGGLTERHELMNLSDRTLRGIGVARCDAGIEGPKLFWVP